MKNKNFFAFQFDFSLCRQQIFKYRILFSFFFSNSSQVRNIKGIKIIINLVKRIRKRRKD